MDVLRQQWLRIQQQLGELTMSQRLLAAALVALVVMTMLYWGRWAATPERVAVLEQSFAPDQAARVVAELERQGIRASVSNDGRVMVPADRQMQAFAAVAYNGMLPRDSQAAIDRIVSQMTIWDSSVKTQKYFNDMKQVMLAGTIARWPGVEDATVHIDPAERRSFSSPSQPRASINIRMRNGERPSKKLILAAADIVIGAQAGLTRSNVTVVVDGVSYPLPDRDSDTMMMAGEILETKQGFERHFASKIREQLAEIPNVFVAVTVQVNTQRTEQERSEVDPKNLIHRERESMSRSDESSQAAPPAEPGAIPNAGLAIPAAASAGSNTASTEERTVFELDYGRTRTRTFQPAGDAKVTAASVRVPRSHFVSLWRTLNPGASQEPDEGSLTGLMTAELAKIRRDVMACVGLRDESVVTVDFYIDTPPPPVQAGSGPSLPLIHLVGSYGKEALLAVMAMAALFMVTGLVKKHGGTVPALATMTPAEQQRELERLAAGEEIAGAAGEGPTALEALELDEETSQTQQMIQQVSNMVKENPDAAVSLLKRWMNRL